MNKVTKSDALLCEVIIITSLHTNQTQYVHDTQIRLNTISII